MYLVFEHIRMCNAFLLVQISKWNAFGNGTHLEMKHLEVEHIWKRNTIGTGIENGIENGTHLKVERIWNWRKFENGTH